MVVQNYKSDLKTKEDDIFLETTGKSYVRKAVKPKVIHKIGIFLSLFSLLFLIVAFVYFAYYKDQEIQQLRDEVNSLRDDVNMLKYRCFDDDLLDEIKAFENEDYGDSETQNEDGEERPFSDNSEDVDFDDNYEYDFDVENDTISSLDKLRKELRLAKLSTKEGDVESNRNKREVLAATIDGVPIIAESYAERKRNKTVITSPEGMKLYETLGKNSDEIPRAKGYEPVHKKYKHRGFHNPVWTARTFVHSRSGGNVAPTPVMSRTSRVMHTNEDKSKAFRRVVKKSLLKSADSKPEQRNYQEQIAGPEATVLPEDVVTNVNPSRRRKHRTRHNLESMDEKQHAARRMPVMHFNGDTSTLVYGQHQRYQGNGRLGHLNGLYKDWATTDWVKNLGMTRYYDLQDGVLTIKETGLYYIYAQIYYLDEHDTNGFRIYNNQNLVAQCITMTHSTTKVIKGNTCFTATVDYLTKGDNLTLKDIEHMRYSLFEPGKSFFGLIKIGDAKAK